jgi:two-component system, chemotaxis family, chemotaxis protein CheY
MKVLLVEDTDGMRKLVGSMLAGMGFDDIITAGNGEEALAHLAAADADLLLTNWSMPVMDGLTLVRAVRAQSRNASLPIIMFTSRASRDDVVNALGAGVDGYVAKPFSPAQLREQIARALQLQRRRQIDHVVKALDPMRGEDEHPLLLLGEQAIRAQDLARAENRQTLRFLDQTATAVDRINSDASPPLVGMTVSADTTELSRQLRRLGTRAKAMILNGKMPGGLTLARLAAVNKTFEVGLFVTCDSKADVPEKVRLGLDRLDVTLIEHGHLDTDSLQQLITEHAVATRKVTRPTELPSPEEINRRLRTDILSTVTLPVMPSVFHDIAELARDPESDMQKWIEVIEADPLSSAQILRRAHSPIYGFRGGVEHTDKAVILLGRNTVKELVVSEAVQRAFQVVQEDQFDIEDFWLHSVCVALVARLFTLPLDPGQRSVEQQRDFDHLGLSDLALAALGRADLATRLPQRASTGAFTAGMMHDIGKVALVHSYPGLNQAVHTELDRNGWNTPMRQAEVMVAGGADHTVVGGILAESWRLGDDITSVIQDHHTAESQDALTSVVALADLVVGGFQPYPKGAPYPMLRLVRGQADATDTEALEALAAFLPTELCARLGLSADDLIELARVLGPEIGKRAQDLRQSM